MSIPNTLSWWCKIFKPNVHPQILDSVPSTGRYVVVIHLYLHYSMHHYSVVRSRLRAVRAATDRLLARNPDAMVVLRGPHTAQKLKDLTEWQSPLLASDVAAPLLRSVEFLFPSTSYVNRFWIQPQS